MYPFKRLGAAVIAVLFGALSPAANASSLVPTTRNLTLIDGRKAVVYPNGFVVIRDDKRKRVEYRQLPAAPLMDQGPGALSFPDDRRLLFDLSKAPYSAYDPSHVLVVFRDGRAPSVDELTKAPNMAFASLGIDRMERLFRNFDRVTLSSMRAPGQFGAYALNPANAFRVHVTRSSVYHAVDVLSKLPEVAYVEPDWRVGTMHARPIPIPQTAIAQTALRAARFSMRMRAASTVPTNYAVTASLQSMLNAPGVDAVAAYDEIEKTFHQLPGEGEIITNVSLGDVDAVGDSARYGCAGFVQSMGPTTELIDGQHYIDWPSMPLIPAYTADAAGGLSGSKPVCNVDPYLEEVGLDFSVMAPLPDNAQRSGMQGSGVTDLFGIAPGAKYRLVVPQDSYGTISDIQAALLAAAYATPRTNVITASLGYGFDEEGMPSRYLEDDPLTEALIAGIVHNKNIVVCIAANDGLRTYTNAAIGPSGGSAATNIVSTGQQPTALGDVEFSTTPSLIYDSGSIDVGGTTLNDIFANPPQYASSAMARAGEPFVETRWTGFTSFSSGAGTRVNVSAPSDNIVAFTHAAGGSASAVSVSINGGTSAAAPEVAAVAAVVQQIGRLTAHPFDDPVALRTYLARTGVPAVQVPQGDPVAMGPQVSVKDAVEQLIAAAHSSAIPSVSRVAIAQRRDMADGDAVFQSDTDPEDIDLQGPANPLNQTPTGNNSHAWITIAPDWENLPKHATFRLTVSGKRAVLATTPYARLLPADILAAAGETLAGTNERTVKLSYRATGAGHAIKADFSLTFSASAGTALQSLAPAVPGVVTGTSIPVHYDLRGISPLSDPVLWVSFPARFSPVTTEVYRRAYAVPLHDTYGTVDVPVSKLQGSGIYGITIKTSSVSLDGFTFSVASDTAFTHVIAPGGITTRPDAPLLGSSNGQYGHWLEFPYDGTFRVAYDVRNVPGANGAILEISAGGPTNWGGSFTMFDNPNGDERDDNGVDTGSVYYKPVSGTSGTITLSGTLAGISPTMPYNVRVLATKGGIPLGESSEISSMIEDGLVAPDGGTIVGGAGGGGFAVNQQSKTGFFASYYGTGADLYAFDQRTMRISNILTPGGDPNQALIVLGGGSVLDGHTGLFNTTTVQDQIAQWNLLTLGAPPSIGSAWPTPYARTSVSGASVETLVAATNQDNPLHVFGAESANGDFLYTWNAQLGTFGQAVDLSQVCPNEFRIVGLPLAEDTQMREALTSANCYFTPSTAYPGTPALMSMNMDTGALAIFSPAPNITSKDGFVSGIAVDSKTNTAAVAGSLGVLMIYNLRTKQGKRVLLPGYRASDSNALCLCGGYGLAADSVHGLFLVAQVEDWPDFQPESKLNNNGSSDVLVYNEAGQLLETISGFQLNDTNFVGGSNQVLQVDPQTRTGYVAGFRDTQVLPFKY